MVKIRQQVHSLMFETSMGEKSEIIQSEFEKKVVFLTFSANFPNLFSIFFTEKNGATAGHEDGAIAGVF